MSKIKYPDYPIYIAKCKIYKIKIDAIMNPVNSKCVWSAYPSIWKHAGFGLEEHCKQTVQDNNNCLNTLHTFVSDAYDLPATYVINVVIPKKEESDFNYKLKQCFIKCLDECKKNKIKKIAFSHIPNIPADDCIIFSLTGVKQWLQNNDYPIKILFCSNNQKYYNKLINYLPKIFKIKSHIFPL